MSMRLGMFHDETRVSSASGDAIQRSVSMGQGVTVSLGLRDFAIRAVPPPAPRPVYVPPPRASALGELLLERDLITGEQLTAAINHQRVSGRRLGQVLIDMGFTTPDAVLGALSIQQGVA